MSLTILTTEMSTGVRFALKPIWTDDRNQACRFSIAISIQSLHASILIFWLLSRVILSLFASDVHDTLMYETYESLHPIDAVVLIVVGRYAKSTMVDQSVASLRQSHLSDSIPILIITDDVECISSALSLSEFDNIAIIHSDDSDGPSPSAMYAKLLKMKMFDYIPLHMDTVLYLDLDILASSGFNEHIIPSFDDEAYFDKNCSLIIQPGRPRTFLEKYSSGSFVAHRVHSSQCLEDWGSLMKTGEYDRDQHALYNATSCVRSMCTLPKGIVKWARNIRTFLPRAPPLIHYTGPSHGTEQDIDEFCSQFSWFDDHSMSWYCWGWNYLRNLPAVGPNYAGRFFLMFQYKNDC